MSILTALDRFLARSSPQILSLLRIIVAYLFLWRTERRKCSAIRLHVGDSMDSSWSRGSG